MRSRRAFSIVFILLLLSLAANVGLFWAVREQYIAVQRVRLDPSSDATFRPLNAAMSAPAPGQRRVVFAGDSRTAMWQPLPELVNGETVNRGMGNDTSGQLLLRWERDVTALKPDLVVLEIGINDIKAIGAVPTDERTIIDRLQANRANLLGRLTAHHTPVIVCTLFPLGEVSLKRRLLWSDRMLEAREEINATICSLHQPGVIVFDADTVLAVNGRLKPEYQRDELHLNPAGYGALNAALAPLIAAQLR